MNEIMICSFRKQVTQKALPFDSYLSINTLSQLYYKELHHFKDQRCLAILRLPIPTNFIE
jgi:hypothetical protein